MLLLAAALVIGTGLVAPRAPGSPPPAAASAGPRPPDVPPPDDYYYNAADGDNDEQSRRELTWNDPIHADPTSMKTAYNYTAIDLTGNCSNGVQDYGEPDIDCGFALDITFFDPQLQGKTNQLWKSAWGNGQQIAGCAENHVGECTIVQYVKGVFCPQLCQVGQKCRMTPLANVSVHFPIRLDEANVKGQDCDTGFCEDSYNTGQGRCVTEYHKIPHVAPRGGRFAHPIRVNLYSYRRHPGDRVHYTKVTRLGQEGQVNAPDQIPNVESPSVPSGGSILIDEDTMLITVSYSAEETFIHAEPDESGDGWKNEGDRTCFSFCDDRLLSCSSGTYRREYPTGIRVTDFGCQNVPADFIEDFNKYLDPNLPATECGCKRLLDSTATADTYQIARGRYGYGYFVPYYNSAIGFSGVLTRLDLQSPGQVPDFANFQTRLGQGAYDGQLRTLDLTIIDPDLKGFQGAFQAVGQTVSKTVTNYAFMVPFFNGRFHGKLTRVNLDFFTICGVEPREDLSMRTKQMFDPDDGTWSERKHPYLPDRSGQATDGDGVNDEGAIPPHTSLLHQEELIMRYPENDTTLRTAGEYRNESFLLWEKLNQKNYTGGFGWKNNFCGVDVIDLEQIDPALTGFNGGFEYGGWGYLVPYTNGRRFTSAVVRFDVSDFVPENVQTLDVAKAQAHQCGGINHPHNTRSRSTTVDPVLCSKSWAGFNGGVVHEGKGYLIPYKHAVAPIQGQHTTLGVNSELPVDKGQFKTMAHGLLVRFDLRSFSMDSVEVLDLTRRDDDLRGYKGGFVHEKYLYLVPYMSRYTGYESSTASRRNSFHGKLTRVDLDRFETHGIDWITLTDLDPDLRGFSNGFTWGNFGVLVPFTNDHINYREKRSFGKVVKIDLTKFDLSAVTVINLPTRKREQIPPKPDHELRGFVDGFAAGDYGYFVPNFNGDFFGKVVRLNMKTDTIQFVDLTQDGAFLSGYSGGFTHTSRRICCDAQMGHRAKKNDPLAVCTPFDFDRDNQDEWRFAKIRNYGGSLDSVAHFYHHNPVVKPEASCFPNCPDNPFRNEIREMRIPPWEPSSFEMPAWVYDVMSFEEWISAPDEARGILGFNAIQPIVDQYPIGIQDWINEELPNWVLYEEIRKRLVARAGGSKHTGAPAKYPAAPGFATMSTDAITAFHMYRSKNIQNNLLNTKIGSKVCNYIDQHQIDYVLWDRRAYTRDWMIPVTDERVLPPRCLFKACKDDRSILPPPFERTPVFVQGT